MANSVMEVIEEISSKFKEVKSIMDKYPDVFSFIEEPKVGWIISGDLSLLEHQLEKANQVSLDFSASNKAV